jgi:4-hydroxybenzoate polyprenyltransferase
MVMIPLLLAAGFLVGALISTLFLGVLLCYYLCTVLYTFWLKRVVLLDTLVLSGLYTLRILAGAAAIVVVPSFWLLAFSMFFFLSIALAKRYAELIEHQRGARTDAPPGREYRTDDLSTIISQGSASGYAAVLVLALYIDSDSVRAQYNHPEIIWLICPLLLYWINKLWLNTQRREISDDPIVWAMTNRVSRGIAVLSALLLLLARWLPR